jgi:CzcA family heavy metal efflux pump
MIRWIVATSLRLRFLVLAGAVALMAFGLDAARRTPVDVFPEFAPPRVEVQTACLGLSAAEVEQLVTVPLEQTFAGLPGLDVIRSKSVAQLSSVDLVFKPGTDILADREVVQERLSTVSPTLPTWAAPPFMLPPLAATSRIMKIGLSSETIRLTELSTIAYWTIRQRLLRVPGVANVAIWGERLQQEHVLVDPDRMRAHFVSLDRVMEATSDSLDAGLLRYSDGAVIGTGGFVDTPNQRFAIRHVTPVTTPRELARVTFPNGRGQEVRLADVARVVEGYPPLFGDAVINDGPGLMLVVEKFPKANTLAVTRGVDHALDELRPGLRGITIDATIFRPATFIESAIDNLTRALWIGCLLVVLVLIAFLFEWRAALVSLVSIPVSLIAAVLVLSWRGETINTMMLAGLAIAVGVVVDDAIIDVENIWRRVREHRAAGGTRPVASVLFDASLEVRRPIIYATLINVVAVLPTLFLEGLSGAFFPPVAVSYSLAVLASLGVALTLTPALSLILLTGRTNVRREPPLARALKRGYAAVLSRSVKVPSVAMAIVFLLFVAGAVAAPRLGSELLPDFKERDFLIHWVSKPGTSATEERRITTRLSREVRAVPGVQNFGSHIGQAFLGEEVAGVNFAENWISIDPHANYDQTHDQVEDVVNSYPGLLHDITTYLKERTEEVLTGSPHGIVVRIYGQNLHQLHATALQVREALRSVDGLSDISVELHEDVPQVEVTVDVPAAARYHLKPGDVRRAMATMVASEEVGDVFSKGKAYDVHVWSTPASRGDLTALRGMMLDTPGGGHVRLDRVAHLVVRPTPNVIEHENTSRKIDVGAEASGRDLGSVVADVRARLKTVNFPRGFHAQLIGEAVERSHAQRRLLLFSLIAAVAIFLLLHAAFSSWRLATIMMVTLPMALVGGVLAALLGGGVLSLGSLVGFLTVLGIAARNGVLLINRYQDLERHEGMPFGPDLVLRGAQDRLSPILMTSLATGLALVPLVITGDIPGHEIEHPMAVVIVGGLITSTLLNLFVLPSLYLRFSGRRAPNAG